MMLVVGRKSGERIVCANGELVIVVTKIRGNRVWIGVEADKSIAVNRAEVEESKGKEVKP
jgi:carbon storage regulator CsrA